MDVRVVWFDAVWHEVNVGVSVGMCVDVRVWRV